MTQKQARCPKCGQENVYDAPTRGEALMQMMPAALAASLGVKAIEAKWRGAGIVAGGLVLAYKVITYQDAISVTCGNCLYEYKVHHD